MSELPIEPMIGHVVYMKIHNPNNADSWRCHLTVSAPDAHIANDVGVGVGASKDEARNAALTYAERALAAIKSEATDTRISYHENPKAIAFPPWRCTLLSNIRNEDGISLGHCVAQGWGATKTEAFGAALAYAEQALATVKAKMT